MSIDEIAQMIQAYLAEEHPGWQGIRIVVDIQQGDEKDQIRHRLSNVRPTTPAIISVPASFPVEATTVSPTPLPPPIPDDEPFVMTERQERIMDALEGKALSARQLGTAIDDISGLYRKGGLQELVSHDLVRKHSSGRGFYRPDAPPAEPNRRSP